MFIRKGSWDTEEMDEWKGTWREMPRAAARQVSWTDQGAFTEWTKEGSLFCPTIYLSN